VKKNIWQIRRVVSIFIFANECLKQNTLFIKVLCVLGCWLKAQGTWPTAKMELIPYLPFALSLTPWAFLYRLHHRIQLLKISGSRTAGFCFFYKSELFDCFSKQSGAEGIRGHLVGCDDHGVGFLQV